MKDSVVRQNVLKHIISTMNDDSARGLATRLKKKEEKKEEKVTKLTGLSDIRRMLG